MFTASLRSLAILLVVCLLSTCSPDQGTVREQLTQIREAALTYLLQEQADDGGWHSETHGILRGGQAYTPFIMDALLQLDGPSLAVEQGVERAFGFLQGQLDSTGVLGWHNPQVAEYPIYATALAYKIWPRWSASSDSLIPRPSLRFLCAQQFIETRGIAPDHPAYGGWGFGEANLPYGEVGHLDLSHTRRVLEALRARGLPDTSQVWIGAEHFLTQLQQPDGGFCASTYTLGANKADSPDRTCVSYATATGDGALALLALPGPPAEALESARAWLLTHEDWTTPSGIVAGQPGNWDKVLYFYHLAVRAQTYAALQVEGDWPARLLKQLQTKQAGDGSFSNPWGAPNKEDDPLLATALVIKAINAALAQ